MNRVLLSYRRASIDIDTNWTDNMSKRLKIGDYAYFGKVQKKVKVIGANNAGALMLRTVEQSPDTLIIPASQKHYYQQFLMKYL